MKYLLPLLLLYVLPQACLFADPPSGFPLGVWYEGGVGASRQNSVPEDPTQAAKQYEHDFADMAAHGINCAVVPNTPPNHHKPLLDAAQKHNLKLIIELNLDGGDIGHMIRGAKPLDMAEVQKILDRDLAPIKNHPALWKIQLLDEPAVGEPFQRYAKVAEALRTYDGNHDAFCCLSGVGAVESFCKITGSRVAAWDFYPVGGDTKPGDQSFLKATAEASTTANQQALKASATTYAVLQAFTQTNTVRFPSPAEIRCMTYLSLATGSRGIFWFIYGTQHLDPEHKLLMAGLTDRDNKQPRDRWNEIAKLTKEISALAPTLNRLTPAVNSNLASSSQFARVLKDDQGRFYVFAVNMNTLTPEKVSLRFGTASEVAGEAEVIQLPRKKKLPVIHDGAEVVWEQTLNPGDATLFRID